MGGNCKEEDCECDAHCENEDADQEEYDEYLFEENGHDDRWTDDDAAKFDEIDEAMDAFWEMLGQKENLMALRGTSTQRKWTPLTL